MRASPVLVDACGIDTTIRGQGDRGTGLLNNTLYIGQLSWNRTSYIKNPATGRRVARVNKNSDREITQVPELRIVDQALWESLSKPDRRLSSHTQSVTRRSRPRLPVATAPASC